ncbi:MAG: ribonuclease III [Puniceicoccales bacterium]|jgi:ribonuclease-3|nr:ribonuclease III [Puniceicoccales bacterium]
MFRDLASFLAKFLRGRPPKATTRGNFAVPAALERTLGHKFKNPALLREALTHPSMKSIGARSARRTVRDYQRLEFLGDAVLGLVLAETFYSASAADEGVLTNARTRLACGRNLAALGRRLHLGDHMRLAQNGDTRRIRESDAANEDMVEAVFGAVFLDGGLDAARKLAKRLFGSELRLDPDRVASSRAAKCRLQERVQSDGRPNEGARIEYRARESGGRSRRGFRVELRVDGRLCGTGEAPSKREAEELAAAEALKNL